MDYLRLVTAVTRPSVQYNIFSDIADFFTETIPELFTETIPNFITDTLRDFGQGLLDSILSALNTFFGMVMWLLECGLCKLVDLIYSMFSVFVGMQKVTLYAESASGQRSTTRSYLLNIMLGQDVVTTVYWGMALIGIILAIVFTLWAVLKKSGDLFDTEKRTYGQILTGLFKSVVIILLMSLIMNVVVAFSSALMSSVSSLFDIATFGGTAEVKVFTSDDFVYMNNVLDTIGAYSLNPSYNSRYNINSCYNAIRPELQYLVDRGVFDVYYRTEESEVYNGEEYETVVNTWQSVIQDIVRANNVDTELKLDVFYEPVNTAILNAMEVIRTDASFKPLAYYEAAYQSSNASSNVSLGTVIYLSGTAEAARNNQYNKNVSMTDAVRGPYFNGTRSIYDYDAMNRDFNLDLTGGINHVMILLLGALILRSLVQITATACVRIFQLILLYVTAPPFIATIPLGEGSLFNNWKKSLLVETFGIFGTVISMRLMILYIPLIASSNLVLFDNSFMDMVGKAILIWGGVEAAKRGTMLISGILTGNAAMAAERAQNTEQQADKFLKTTGLNKIADAPGEMASAVAGAPSTVADATGISSGYHKLTDWAKPESDERKSWVKNGGIAGSRRSENMQKQETSARRAQLGIGKAGGSEKMEKSAAAMSKLPGGAGGTEKAAMGKAASALNQAGGASGTEKGAMKGLSKAQSGKTEASGKKDS